jgi:8-oxo-dGTP diphosphatase
MQLTGGALADLYEMPFTRIELAVLAVANGRLEVLLGRRDAEPYRGRWALPGGVLRIDLDADLEAAARRTARERLNVDIAAPVLLTVAGARKRDPRAPWSLSIVFRILVEADRLQVSAGKRLGELKWMDVDEAGASGTLAFDHAALVAEAAAVTRAETDRLDLPQGLLPESFTLGELQQRCEAILGRALDKSSFRRRLADRGVVEPVEGEFRGGANRPAQVYRLA